MSRVLVKALQRALLLCLSSVDEEKKGKMLLQALVKARHRGRLRTYSIHSSSFHTCTRRNTSRTMYLVSADLGVDRYLRVYDPRRRNWRGRHSSDGRERRELSVKVLRRSHHANKACIKLLMCCQQPWAAVTILITRMDGEDTPPWKHVCRTETDARQGALGPAHTCSGHYRQSKGASSHVCVS